MEEIRSMKTALSAVAVAAALVLAPLAGGPFAATDDSAQQHGRFSPEDRAAFLDVRIAALKAGLELNADQQKNWAPLESAIRDLAKERAGPLRRLAGEARDGWRRDRQSQPNRPSHQKVRIPQQSRRRPREAGDRRQAALRQPRRRPEAPVRLAFPSIHGPRPLAPRAPRGLKASVSLSGFLVRPAHAELRGPSAIT
jgi:hypothetical protein